eukprot:CAMPEP_0183748428 /NCGR_PEP_ID=MMETSP0737-20130205/67766_1 /TAXON_ID=385413 /ORGANISM="Thalassiosira miniscula, Strain CCMP1093" /LENGTH=414 /DNA_ID=CAMNT_0025984151 /DNA_START=75 /DNA_END=1319 /DNA_ORIENTATION=-
MVRNSSTLGLVAISMAALSVDKLATGFVSPKGRSMSSPQKSPLQMSISMPDDGSKNWDKSQSSQASDSSIPNDGLDSIESSSDFGHPYETEQYNGYDGAFPLPDSVIPETRQLRWEREALLQSKFVNGDELFELRSVVSELRRELINMRARVEDENSYLSGAEKTQAKRSIALLERELLKHNERDAEFTYAVALELLEKAQEDGDEEMAKKYSIQAEEARLCIPQLNMHGLWVGKYGDHGYEMINVTYSGDTLIATKVTGDKNVPKGEVTFTADLSPKASLSDPMMAPLDPIELNPKASQQWGKKYLPRHLGKGQVAGENFSNAQWMDGQLIMVGRFFSFAWVPIGHQVFFGRPSSELTLKMWREAKEEELRKDHVAVMREVVEGMWDETYWAERERSGENYFMADYEEEGCFE